MSTLAPGSGTNGAGTPRPPNRQCGQDRCATRPEGARKGRMAQSFAQVVAVLMRDPVSGTSGSPIWSGSCCPPSWPVNSGSVTRAGRPRRAKPQRGGVAVPVAVALWARVSPQVDKALSENLDKQVRLRPNEWTSGDNVWLMAMAGHPRAVRPFLKQLTETRVQGPPRESAPARARRQSDDQGRGSIRRAAMKLSGVKGTERGLACIFQARHPASGRERQSARAKPRRDRQGALAGPALAPRSRQVGHLHGRRPAGVQERPEPVRAQRVCRHPHGHAAQPAVRGAEVHLAAAAAAAADAGADDPLAEGRGDRCRVRRPVRQRACRAPAVLPRGLQRLCGRPRRQSLPQPDHQPGSAGGPPAHRVLRAPEVERVLPEGGLRDVLGAVRARHQVPPELPGPEPQRGLDLRHRGVRAGQPGAAAVQGPLRGADPHARLQQHARQPR